MDPVIDSEIETAVCGRDHVIGAELSPALPHFTQSSVKRVDISVAEREYEAPFVGILSAVFCPLLDELGPGLALAFRANGMNVAAALALTAALFHVFNHSVFKSLLFFGAGAVLTATGESAKVVRSLASANNSE